MSYITETPTTRPDLADLTLEDILPHRRPMLLIDKVLAVDTEQAKTLSRVSESWPLQDEGGVHPLILIELAAQTVGICNGWDRIKTKGIDSNQMGWIVGIKKADIHVATLPIGTEIVTTGRNSYVFDNFREAESEIFINERSVATVSIQIFQKEENEEQ